MTNVYYVRKEGTPIHFFTFKLKFKKKIQNLFN